MRLSQQLIPKADDALETWMPNTRRADDELDSDHILGSYTLTLGSGTSVFSPDPTGTPSTPNPRKPAASQLGTAISLAILGALFILLGLVYCVLLCSQRRSRAQAAKNSHASHRERHTKSKGRDTPVSPIDKSSRAMSPSSLTTLSPSPTPSPRIIYLDISPATVPPDFDEDDDDDMFFAPLSPLPPARTVQPRQAQHWKAIQDRWPGSTFARDHAVLEPIPGSPSTPSSRRDVVSIYSTISLGAFGPPDERRNSFLSVDDAYRDPQPARPMSTLSLHSISTPLGER